jgi:HSP20 family protein
MLVQTDPFRDFDAFFDRLGGSARASARAMPMDAYRRGEDVWVHVDLPGIAVESLEISVERSVLTVTAQRQWRREEGDQLYLNERPTGTFRRQLNLGEGLDVEHIEADYEDGVLTLRIPVAERAKPRRISVKPGDGQKHAIDASSTTGSSSTTGGSDA